MNNFYPFAKKASKKIVLMFFLMVLLFPTYIFGQIVEQVSFEPRTSPFAGNKAMYNIRGDFITMGNTNLTWHWRYGFNHDIMNNWMEFVNTDLLNSSSLRNSSSSTLRFSTEQGAVPACSRVIFAGVYWTGRTYNIPPPTFPTVPYYDPDDYLGITYDNTFDSVPVVVWRTDTAYVVVDEIHAWYSSTEYLPTNPPEQFGWECVSGGGPGFIQVFTIPEQKRIFASSRTNYSWGGMVIPYSMSYQDWVGAPYNWLPSPPIYVPGYYSIIPSPSGDVSWGFPGITVYMNGLDSVQISGVSMSSNCSSGNQRLRVTTKVMRMDIYDVVDTVIWYRKDEIKLRHENDTYFTLRAQTNSFTNDIYWAKGDQNTGVYVGYADITDYVSKWGEGEYFVADIALQAGPSGTPGLFGGWGMVVVYENEMMIPRSISVLDGYTVMNGGGDFEAFIDGFNPVEEGPVGVNVGVMAGGGAASRTNDTFSISLSSGFNYTPIPNPVSGSETNFFANTIYTGVLPRNPSLANNTGMNITMMGIDNIDNLNIDNDQHSTSFRFTAGDDTYILYNLAASVFAHIPEPQIESKLLTIDENPVLDISSAVAFPGSVVQYTLKLRNKGSEPLENLKIEVMIPYLTQFVSAEIFNYDLRVLGNRVIFNPLVGAMGQIIWEIDYLPLTTLTEDDVFAELILTLQVTEECNLLAVSGTCEPVLILNGTASGVGARSGYYFDGVRFIYGFVPSGDCVNDPIYTPTVIPIESECGEETRKLYVCIPSEAASIPYATIAGAFPPATRFYDIIDFENKIPLPASIEYTSANPFPTVSPATYYALPSAFTGAGIEACYWEFEIHVDNYPEFIISENISKCGGDSVNLMNYVIISPENAIPYFYYDSEFTQMIDSIITPTYSKDYYVVAIIPMRMGCISNETVHITVLPTLTEEFIDIRDTVLCFTNEDLILTASLMEELPEDVPLEMVEFLWYDSQTSTEPIGTGSSFNAHAIEATTDIIDTTFYVAIRDLSDPRIYCPTPVGYRKPVNVKIYPQPELYITADHYNLCGPATITLYPELLMGSDRSNISFLWERETYDEFGNPNGWETTVNMSPMSSGTDLYNEFYYTPSTEVLAQDSIVLRLTITPNVCPAISEIVTLYVSLSYPNGFIEMVDQPKGEQEPCKTSEYIVRVTEAGLGGLTNIQVTLDDYMLTNIKVEKVEYLYPVINNDDWNPMDLLRVPEELLFIASIPPLDDIQLEKGDSLWVRFTTYTDCGFFSGNDYRFILSGTDICDESKMPESTVKSAIFQLNFGKELPDFWLESSLNPEIITNESEPIEREVTWTVEWVYLKPSGDVDPNKVSIYFNIPTEMEIISLKSVPNTSIHNNAINYNYNAEELAFFKTDDSNDLLIEYKIPLPDLDYETLSVLDTIKFEVVFTEKEMITCGDYEFYMEIIYEDLLPCYGEECNLGDVRVGSYPILTIDLYSFEPLLDEVRNQYVGEVMQNGDFVRGSFRMITHSYLHEGHEIEITFYADMDNDGFLDLDMDTPVATIPYTIDKDYNVGDTVVIDLTDQMIPMIYGKQFLVAMGGYLVCQTPAGPLVTLFGKQKVCVGETSMVYAPEGSGITAYIFELSSDGRQSFSQTGITPMGSGVEFTFNNTGTYTISARYVPTAGRPYAGKYLNYTYIDIEVYPYPVLAYTLEADTTICRGEQVELAHFIYDLYDQETVITFYREETDESLTLLGDTETGEPIVVIPWNTTKYKAVAENGAGCVSEMIDFWVYVKPMPQVWATVTAQPTCTQPGTITITVTGGSGVYSYSTDGVNYEPLGEGIISKQSGTYTIYIIDEESPCDVSVSEPVTLTPNSGLYATATATDASDCTSSNGTIKLWADLGEEPYQYSLNGTDWEDMPEDSIIGTFAAGTHTLWVQDAKECVAVTTATIKAGEGGITLILDKRDADCKDDGVIFIEIAGNATPDYTYHMTGQGWVNMAAEIDSLPANAGTHTITVQDGAGCTATETITVGTTSSTLAVTIDATSNVVCEGTLLGSITFTVTGVNTPFAYALNAGFITGTVPVSGTTVTIPGLQTGTYHLEITDWNLCSYTKDDIVIDKENDILRIETKDTTVCNGITVNLGSLITSLTENVTEVKFYSDKEYETEITNLNVTTQGRRYVKAFNSYNCFVGDSVFVRVLPVATPGDITAANVSLCVGGDTALRAIPNINIENPVIIWYDKDGTVLGEGYRLPIEIPDFTYNKDTIFYVAVKGDNYCENAPNNRTAATVSIFPYPSLSLMSPTPNLCGKETQFLINVTPNVGTNNTGATYQWWRLNPVSELYEEIVAYMVNPPAGYLSDLSVYQFVYTIVPEDQTTGFVNLMLSIDMPVCGPISQYLTVNIEAGTPDGAIELVVEPTGPQEPCKEVYYIVKVTETGDGGLSNIMVTMRDWFGSVITVTEAHCYYNEIGWDDIETIEWDDMEYITELVLGDSIDYIFTAFMEEDFRLENKDSLLIRFTAIAECGFYAGNNYLFELTGTDACGGVHIPYRSDESKPFDLLFYDELPGFWLESEMSSIHITNEDPERVIVWSIIWGYNGEGDVDPELQSIYFNIPTGMSLLSVKSTGKYASVWNLNYDVMDDDTFLLPLPDGIETGFDDPETKEYQIKLPDFGQPFYERFINKADSLSFEIIFSVDEDVACDIFNLYVEIIHEDNLYCETEGSECLFGFIKVGDYHSLEIDLYNLNMEIDITSPNIYGIMYQEDEETWLWGGSFALRTLTELYYNEDDPHYIDFTFYADLNNNGILDDDEISEENEMGYLRHFITKDYAAGDTMVIRIDPENLIETENGYQLLVKESGKYICLTDAYPLVTLFGPQIVCEGDTMNYYTAEGMMYYSFGPGSSANIERIPLEGNTEFDLTESEARYVFHTPGTYQMSVYYSPSGTGNLNRTFMEVTVTERPVLAFTSDPSTIICRGTEIELLQFFEAIYNRTTDPETLIELYVENDGEYVLIGDSNDEGVFVSPWNNTTYRAVAYNANGCVCIDSLDFTVNVNVMPQVFATVTTQPTCEGDEGSIQINITGGIGPYSYNLDGGTGRIPMPSDFTLRGLETGNYTIYLYDEGNLICSPAISEPPVVLSPPSGLTASVIVTNAHDCDEATGTIMLTASNGKPQYQYFIEGISTEFENIPTDGFIGNFKPNTYNITVKDQTGCFAATSAIVGVEPGVGIILTLTEITVANCEEQGIMGMKVSGGSPPYKYRLASEGLITMSSDSTAFPLSAGVHTIYVQDDEGCNTVESITMSNAPDQLSVEIDSIITVKCEGNSLGAISFSVYDAQLPITYSLNGNFNTGMMTLNMDTTITGLQTGVYNLLIVDANRCTFAVDAIIVGEDRHMPTIVKKDTSICVGNEVDLTDLILPASDYETILFFYDKELTNEIDPPVVTDTVVYYVRAFNIYDCYVDDSLHVKSWPYGNELTISTVSLPVCSGGETNITATASGVIEPYYRWYADNEEMTPLEEGTALFITPIQLVSTNTDTVFYVSVEGKNYCENPAGKRKPITVSIFPIPELTLSADPEFLCGMGQTSSLLTYDLNEGTDPNVVTGYNWRWRNPNTYEWIEPNHLVSGGFETNNPSGSAPLPTSFNYLLSALDMSSDSIVLVMNVITSVCNGATDTIIILNNAQIPYAEFEWITQPDIPQTACSYPEYVVKITEVSGGLTDIQVTLKDLYGSLIQVSEVYYISPIPDEEEGENGEWDWIEIDFNEITDGFITDPISDLILTHGESALVKFVTSLECGFFGGNRYQFLLDGRDYCHSFPLQTQDITSKPLILDFGYKLPEFYMNSWLTPDIVNNVHDGDDNLVREVTWTVHFVYNSGDIDWDEELVSVYFNVPTGMEIISVKRIENCDYDFEAEELNDEYETGYPDPTTKEYALPLPEGIRELPNTDTVKFDITFLVTPEAVCGIYDLYVEIIHEDLLWCGDEECPFGGTLAGSYHELEIDLYRIYPVVVEDSEDYYGVMKGNEWSGVYAIRAGTPIFAGDMMMGIIYADMNNNNILDDGDMVMDTIYYPTAERQTGDIIPVYVGMTIPETSIVIPPATTEDGKQILIYITGTNVCESFAGQAVPIFGEYQVCQGEPVTYYTANGMLRYEWDILDQINGEPVDNTVAQLTLDASSAADSVVQAVFHKPGKYAIYTHYIPGSGEMQNVMLNRTYMEIEVTPKPYLAFTYDDSIDICFGERVDLGAYIHDTVTGNNTILHYEKIEADGINYTPLGYGSSVIVEPWETTSYRITGTTENGICESANAVIFTVNVHKATRIEAISIVTNPTCTQPLGQVMLTVLGGSGNYQYSLDGETYDDFSSSSSPYYYIRNLSPNTYTIYVKDNTNTACPAAASNSFTLSANNSGLYATVKIDSATHCTSSDGIITLTINGGKFPYEYSLNGGEYLPYLPPGVIGTTFETGHYNIIVKDNEGCTASAGDVFVPAITGLSMNLSLLHPAQCDTTGMILIEMDGGAEPYEYHLDGYGWRTMTGTIDSIYALPGTRTIAVKDDNRCEVVDKIEVTNEGANLAIFDVITQPPYCGTMGWLSFNTTGEPTPLHYSLSNFAVDDMVIPASNSMVVISSLSLGEYHITLRDAKGCFYVTESIKLVALDDFLQPVDEFATTYVNVPVDGELTLIHYKHNNTHVYFYDYEMPKHGTIEYEFYLNDNIYFTYTPSPGYVGLDTAKYFITDGCNIEEAYLYITVLPLYDLLPRPPIAQNDFYFTWLNTPLTNENVLANDDDPDDGALTASLIGDGTTAWGGTVTLEEDGTFVYTPRPGFLGTDEFKYKICNDAEPSLCDSAVVYIYVRDSSYFDLLIRAINNNYITPKQITLEIDPLFGILSNDIFPDDLDEPLEISLITDVNNGTLALNLEDGSFVYTPDKGFIGSDGFTYRICGTRDDITRCSDAYVSIFVYDYCGDMPVLALDNGFICLGDEQDLTELIIISDFVDSVAFYSDSDRTLFIDPPYATTEGYYYARAWNEYNCYVDTFVYVTVYPTSEGGSVAADQTICSGNTPEPLTLEGTVVGNVIRWEYSTDNFETDGIAIANTTTTLTSADMGALTTNTYYRAVVKSGVCDEAYSTAVLITVDPTTVGGTVSEAQTICYGSSPDDLTLSDYFGNVVKWQYSEDDFDSDINDIANTTATLTIGSLFTDRSYRAVIQSGVCPPFNSNAVLIAVSELSESVMPSDTTICSGGSATFTLQSYTGDILTWQSSTNGKDFVDIPGSEDNATLITGTLSSPTDTMWYRVVVQNMPCPTDTSDIVWVAVSKTSVAGYITPNDTTVCEGNAAILTVNDYVGDAIQWQISTNGTNFTDITGEEEETLTTQTLTASTWYRAVIASGVCPADTTVQEVVTVSIPSVAGHIVEDPFHICFGKDTLLTVTGITGDFIQWQSSTTSGTAGFSDIDIPGINANTVELNIYNLMVDTWYRVVVANEVCPADTSDAILIEIDLLTIGGIVMESQTICSQFEPDALDLMNELGDVLEWQYSDDYFATAAISMPGTADLTTLPSSIMGELTANRSYRAVVQHGVCLPAFSDTVTITVDPTTVGGFIEEAQTLCSGGIPDTLKLSGITGVVLEWQYSTDNFVSPGVPVLDSEGLLMLPSELMGPLSMSTYYRAMVKSGVCVENYSDTVLITVIPKPSLSDPTVSSDSICESRTATFNSILSGGVGTPTYQWQYYAGSATGWIDVVNGTPYNAIYLDANTETLTVSNILIPRDYQYRLTVSMTSGCTAESTSKTITVFAAPNEGTVIPESNSVCYNTGTTLTLEDYAGPIRWQKSTTSATTGFTDIPGATEPTLSTGNLTQTTWFRVSITNEVCGNVVSEAAEISITPDPTLALISAMGTDAQTVRQPQAITDIVYKLTGDVDVNIIGLPDGLSWNVTGDILTISGAPLVAGTFNYQIMISSECGEDMATGIIIVKQACPPEKYDEINDETYWVVELVGFCWYRDNVRGTRYQDEADIAFAQAYYSSLHNNIEQNTINFGLLYTYDDLIGGELCPQGWRLPSSEEWLLLNRYNVNELRNPVYWLKPNDHTNTTDFDARGAGYYNSSIKRFEDLYGYTAWWTSDATMGNNTVFGAIMRYYCNDAIEIVTIKKNDAISIRCLFDD